MSISSANNNTTTINKTHSNQIQKANHAGSCYSQAMRFLVRYPLETLIITFCPSLINENFNRATFDLKSHKLHPIAEKRFTEMEKRCHAIALRMGVKQPEKVQVMLQKSLFSPATFFAATGSQKQARLLFSPLFLMKKEDLPSHLDLTLIDQGKMTEVEWLLSFVGWLFKEQLHIFPPHFTTEQRQTIELNLKCWLDVFRHPEYEKMLDFFIGHEIGHVLKKDSIFTNCLKLIFLIISTAVTVAAAIACSYVVPVILAICIGITLGYLVLYGTKKLMDYNDHRMELRADRISATLEGHAEAGAAAFETRCKRLLLEKQKNPILSSAISAEGDAVVSSTTHPKDSKRASLLREQSFRPSIALKA